MPLIPWLASALAALLASWKTWFLMFMATAIGPFIIKLLLGFGVGYVTYELGSFALSDIFNDFKSSLSGLPSDLLAFVSLAKMDSAVGILFGGLAARLALAGFTSATSGSGSKRSMVLRGDD